MRIVPVEGKDLPLVKTIGKRGSFLGGIEDQFEHFQIDVGWQLWQWPAWRSMIMWANAVGGRSAGIPSPGLGRGLTRAMINRRGLWGLNGCIYSLRQLPIIFIALVSVLSIARRFMRRCWGQNSFALCAHPMLFLCTSNCKAPSLLAEGPCRFDTVILGLNASCRKQCQFLLPKVKLNRVQTKLADGNKVLLR